jgi:type VI protein secretion system component VasK
MENDPAGSIVFRNSGFFVGVLIAGSVVTALLTACMLILAAASLFPLRGLTFNREQNVFWWFLGALTFATVCSRLWVQGRRMAYYQVKADTQGVEFQFGTRRSPALLRMEWSQIRAVQRIRNRRAQSYIIIGQDGSTAMFSSHKAFRTEKLARLIAARSRQAIEEI